MCNDTKSVTIPEQSITLSVNSEYKTYCKKCKVYWNSYRNNK